MSTTHNHDKQTYQTVYSVYNTSLTHCAALFFECKFVKQYKQAHMFRCDVELETINAERPHSPPGQKKLLQLNIAKSAVSLL